MTRHRSQEERREQILNAAKHCFIRDGFAHTRVDDIAQEAGLSKGGIYFHFSSKREIFDALHDREYERIMSLIRTVGELDIPVPDMLEQLSTLFVHFFQENEEHRRFLIVLGEMGMREPEVHAKIIASHKSYIEALTSIIARGREKGEVGDIDPAGVALFLKLLIDGIEQGFALGYDIDVERLTRTGLRFLRRGLSVEKD